MCFIFLCQSVKVALSLSLNPQYLPNIFNTGSSSHKIKTFAKIPTKSHFSIDVKFKLLNNNESSK